MADVTPFLSLTNFVGMFRPLSAAESVLADKVLKAVAVWIRDPSRRPDIAADDPMAELVSFEVTRDSLPGVAGNGMSLGGLTSYSVATDSRSEAGTIAELAGLLDFTDRHKELLGLATTATPTYGGMDGSFDCRFGTW